MISFYVLLLLLVVYAWNIVLIIKILNISYITPNIFLLYKLF